jgi:transposase
VVADKGYQGREVLKLLDAGPWTTRIAEPARRTVLRWHGDLDARRAVYTNRARLLSGSPGWRSCCVRCCAEPAFVHVLDRGGMRRTWLRGRDNVAKRYLVHIAAYNLGLVMRALVGAGIPRAAADLRCLGLSGANRLLLVLVLARPASIAAVAITTLTPDDPSLSTGC